MLVIPCKMWSFFIANFAIKKWWYVSSGAKIHMYLPLPRLNLTPPRISLWPSLSWSHTVNSRDRSQSWSSEMSSQAMVCSHFGQTVLRQTPVFCLPPLAFSGNKYLRQDAKKCNLLYLFQMAYYSIRTGQRPLTSIKKIDMYCAIFWPLTVHAP